LSVVKDRDPRIGACADTGHWVRSGLKPLECLKILQGHIMSVHLHDESEMSPTRTTFQTAPASRTFPPFWMN